ncbi:hypothetical protein ACFXOL_10920 [Streptomyces californicus]|uniref:hypothetical protein n=1 Tax=Streptomyces californicus TaxID=67351 RepID=UPI003662B22B
MWDSLIAVVGTLAGVALASTTQFLTDRRSRAAERHQRVVDTTDQLLGAILQYRELFWLMVADLREGRPEAREDRAARFRARSEITRARDRLALITADPALHAAAKEAAWSAIDLSDIPTGPPDADGRFGADAEAALDAGRERSREAHTSLRRAVTSHIHGTAAPAALQRGQTR